jgi:nucleoside-diphosphate-sugar epimerase
MLNCLPKEKLKKIDIIFSDLRDYNAVEGALKDIDIVFHLGALVAIPYSYVYPREVVETNIFGTLNVLMGSTKNKKIKKIVNISSSEVYGSALYVPIDENHPLQAQSPYSASKIGAEKIAESFVDSYGLPVVIVRPFNAYGPRQSLRAIIPTIISQALVGNSIKLGSLAPRRDFTYVKDTVEAFIKIAESEKTIGRVINIGTNYDVSIGELIHRISKIMGKEIRVVQNKQRIRPKSSEVKVLKADNRLARKLTGWEPRVTLDGGLRMTIDWFRENIVSIGKRQKIKDYTI